MEAKRRAFEVEMQAKGIRPGVKVRAYRDRDALDPEACLGTFFVHSFAPSYSGSDKFTIRLCAPKKDGTPSKVGVDRFFTRLEVIE